MLGRRPQVEERGQALFFSALVVLVAPATVSLRIALSGTGTACWTTSADCNGRRSTAPCQPMTEGCRTREVLPGQPNLSTDDIGPIPDILIGIEHIASSNKQVWSSLLYLELQGY